MSHRIDGLSPNERAALRDASKIFEEYLHLHRRQIAKIEFAYAGVWEMVAAIEPVHRGAAVMEMARNIRETIMPQIEAAREYEAQAGQSI